MARTKRGPKRGYSYEFLTRSKKDVHINMRRVPPELKKEFKAKCQREGLSMRNVVLTWAKNWTAGRRPDESTLEDISLDEALAVLNGDPR